jgi:hypothetical protein
MEVCNDEKTRTREAVRMLRQGNAAEELSRTIGRPVDISEAAILFSVLCEHKDRPDQTRLFVACAKALENEVRGVRTSAQTSGAPYQPEDIRQWLREHSDAMQALSRLLAYFGEEAWKNGSWENAVPRVAHNVAARVDRLKAIGNGQVPAVVRKAWHVLCHERAAAGHYGSLQNSIQHANGVR